MKHDPHVIGLELGILTALFGDLPIAADVDERRAAKQRLVGRGGSKPVKPATGLAEQFVDRDPRHDQLYTLQG